MRVPAARVLSWAAGVVGPGSKVAGITGLREGANPWLLHFDRGANNSWAVLKVGDLASVRQRAAWYRGSRAATRPGTCLAAPRLIAADLDGSVAGAMAMLTTAAAGQQQDSPGSSARPAPGAGCRDSRAARDSIAAATGAAAADEILDGWQRAAGQQADHVAYWDVVAALCTVGDMACRATVPAETVPA